MPKLPTVLVTLALTSCLSASGAIPELDISTADAGDTDSIAAPTPRVEPRTKPAGLQGAPGDAARLEFPDDGHQLSTNLATWFDWNRTTRLHAQLDRPLYRPGETAWIKVWDLTTRTLDGAAPHWITVQLLDPRGTPVATQQLPTRGAGAQHAFDLPASAPGGEWTVVATAPDGSRAEHPFIVASYQAPRIKKTLEFVREAYGPGDRVEAAVTLERSTGELLANTVATARVQADGVALDPIEIQTDARGEATVRFDLPAELQRPDVLLTVLVDDGGGTESISRPVPVVLGRIQLSFFAEGGEAVEGLRNRVYFEASDPFGEPADIEGAIVDDRGQTIAPLRSWHDGRGHVSFTPKPGRTYFARVDAPADLETRRFALPEAQPEGCVLRHHDDLDGVQQAVRVSVTCTDDQEVVVLASQQEQLIDKAALQVEAGQPTTVHLRSGKGWLSGAQGIARVTLFEADSLDPIAERLVFRNKSRQLGVEITPHRESYGPRDEVRLTVRTTDPEGRPVPAEVALAVVDDTVLSHADDEEHSLLSQVLLQADLPEPIADVAKLFDEDEEDGALALDLVLGTRGWRRFDWLPVQQVSASLTLAAPTPVGRSYRPDAAQPAQHERIQLDEDKFDGRDDARRIAEAVGVLDVVGAEAEAVPGVGALGSMAELGDVANLDALGGEQLAFDGAKDLDVAMPMGEPQPVEEPPLRALKELGYVAAGREARAGKKKRPANRGPMARQQQAMVPTRVFPRPQYSGKHEGPRTDFRDTVMWEPALATGADGRAEVRFHLSDAVTGFRAVAEGVGRGSLGRGEALVSSTLPFQLQTRLPVALSAGDRLMLPVTLTNQRQQQVEVDLQAALTGLLSLEDGVPGSVMLAPGARRTLHIPVTVDHGQGDAELSLTATAGGLDDSMQRVIPVVPRGFPATWSQSGVLEAEVTHTVNLPAHVEPGSLTGQVTVYPSPVSEMLEGLEGLVRQPGGCFEQTSSTNYPNILVLDWLDRSGGGGTLSVDRQQVLKAGYDKLTGYQVAEGGFETWGTGPGKEVLSAYGLLQFSDMQRVFDVDPDILDNDVRYLYDQRNGKGGFETTGSSAHGYGSAPPKVLDGYITWAMVETGHHDLKPEIEAQARLARTTTDPYQLALATLTLLHTRPDAGQAAAARLAKLQAEDGSFPGSESTIQRSAGQNLLVESSALSTMALARAGELGAAHTGVRWLHDNRMGNGVWGATQANMLALKAISAVADANAVTRGAGRITVAVDGEVVGEVTYEAGAREALDLDLGPYLAPGRHTLTLTHDGAALPYTIDTAWTSATPLSDPERRVELTTSLSDATVSMGQTTRLTATVTNRTAEVVPDPIARIGIPAGLQPQTWQLQQLRDRGLVAFYETRPREVTLYWDGVHPDESHTIDLDLVAEVPGTFTAPASSAYPYYDDHTKAWVAGLDVKISAR